MIRFASARRLVSRVIEGRCVQQIRTPGYLTNIHLQFHTYASSGLKQPRPTSTNKLTIRPVNWPALRLCHGGSRETTERANSKGNVSLRAVTQAPKPAIYTGISVLIPFVSVPAMMAAAQSFYPNLAFAQMVYGACIVSFLGGARWGFAIPPGSPARPDWMNLGNSVVPSLLAWMALLCRDNVVEGTLVVIMGLGLSLLYDLTLLPGYPPWFKAMRTIFTLVATFSLVATLIIKQFYCEKIENQK